MCSFKTVHIYIYIVEPKPIFQQIMAVLLLAALLQLASAGCQLGSRDACSDHGVCKSSSFSPDPFFNKCKCDFCYDDFECGTNICLFFAAPVAFVFCILCMGCICKACQDGLLLGGIAALAATMTRGNREATTSSGSSRQPLFAERELQPHQPQPSQQVTPFSGATAPPQTARTFRVTCPAGVSPGSLLEAVTPEGFAVQVMVPEGIGPGKEFSVQY